MNGIAAIARNELLKYFATPVAWAILAFVVALSGLIFVGLVQSFRDVHAMAAASGWQSVPPELLSFRDATFGVMANLWAAELVVVLIVTPVTAMGLVAQERAARTLDGLFASGASAADIAVGKYLAALMLLMLAFALTWTFPLCLWTWGTPIEAGVMVTGFLAVALWISAILAMCLFISAMCDSQAVAAVVAIGAALGWATVPTVAASVPARFRPLFDYFSYEYQLQPLLRGAFDIRPIVFLASVTLLFLFATERAIEGYRRG